QVVPSVNSPAPGKSPRVSARVMATPPGTGASGPVVPAPLSATPLPVAVRVQLDARSWDAPATDFVSLSCGLASSLVNVHVTLSPMATVTSALSTPTPVTFLPPATQERPAREYPAGPALSDRA